MILKSPSRRALLATGLAAGLAPSLAPGMAAATASIDAKLEALEKRAGGRLGVSVHGLAATAGWRADERFALCSTFKFALAGVVLREAEAGRLSLEERLPIVEDELRWYAPYVSQRRGEASLPVLDLAMAAQTTSDNAAANMLLRRLGGPGAFTGRLREIGDATTRLDRYEPELNGVRPDDPRDTTTPAAIASTIRAFLEGGALTAANADLLFSWMLETNTGLKRLRAGLPDDLAAGDKTGTAFAKGLSGKINDIAAARTGAGGVVAIAAYYEAPGSSGTLAPEHEAVLADVGRIIGAALR